MGTWLLAGLIPKDICIGDTYYPFYLDAPISLALMYKGNPTAVIAAYVDTGSSLVVNEIQAVRPHISTVVDSKVEYKKLSSNKWELEPLDWQKFLIDSLARIAAMHGIQKIGIQSAVNNRWTKPEDGEVHLPLERAEKIYDQLALSLGMKPIYNRNYEMDIEKILSDTA